jgi:N6-adenosine-specific RNA methylase IME4
MNIAPPPFGSYRVVLADPPWQFDTHSDAGQKKGASQKYRTLPTPEIVALYEPLNLEWICFPDCVLIMWTTWSMLARGDAHAVMEGWRFKPVSGGCWFKETTHGKDGFGLGYILRDSCEPFLIGTRGQPERRVKNVRNGFRAKLGDHSEKPEYLHRAMERMYPGGPFLELFSRRDRKNWTAWGDQAGLLNEGTDVRQEAAV